MTTTRYQEVVGPSDIYLIDQEFVGQAKDGLSTIIKGLARQCADIVYHRPMSLSIR